MAFASVVRLASGLALALSLAASLAAEAADSFAPAVVINDQLVTEFDIAQRQRLMQLMGALQGGDARQQAIETLIDDTLRAQAAKNMGIRLSDEQLNAALAEFAGQRRLTVDQMFAALAKAGVAKQTMIDLIGSQAAFREAMRRRFLAQSTPTDTEVAAERTQRPAALATELRLAELVLAVQERGPEKTEALAQELYQSLSAGGDFDAAARKFSRSPSGKKGGDIGWVPLERLPANIASELALLNPGQVTRPINVPNAVVMLKLVETRNSSATPAAPAAAEAVVKIGRLVVPVPKNASETDIAAAQVEAERIGRELRTCADVEARKAGYARPSGTEGPVPIARLTEAERVAISGLAPGQVSTPFRVADGVAVVLLCERSGTPAGTGDDLAAIRQRITTERLVAYASGFLQEMRRDAVIEYR